MPAVNLRRHVRRRVAVGRASRQNVGVSQPGPARIAAAFLLLTLIWGTTWAAIRLGLEGLPPFTGVALRFLVAGTLLLALVPAFGVRFAWSRREVGLWVLNGALAFSTSYSVVYWAEQYIPSGLAAVLFATYPLFVAGLAHVSLPGERLSARAAAGVLLGFAGVAVIFSDDLRALGGEQVRSVAAVFLVSPIVSAVATVAVKRWGAGIHPLSLTAVPMLLTGLVVGALALLLERRDALVLDLRSLAALVYLAVLGSAVTFTVYYWMLAHASATRVALVAYTNPIVAVAVGALAFGEPVPPKLMAGGALVLLGVAIVNRARRPGRRP
jgi:drug/metabolite transporter (DMT)-like permease